jgi:undecaprenyl diphosphate synthase
LHGLPDPDLLIRTGGEQRISNFLLWNLAYTELYFCDTLWPDFGERELDAAMEYFRGRQRRFGRVPGRAARQAGEHS